TPIYTLSLHDALPIFSFRKPMDAVTQTFPFLFDQFPESFDSHGPNQNLDARFVQIVAPAQLVIDAHDRVGVGEQILPVQSFSEDRAEDGRSAQAATDANPKDGVRFRCDNLEGQVVNLHEGAVFGRAREGHLEFSGQESQFGMESAPLPQKFAVRTWVEYFFR